MTYANFSFFFHSIFLNRVFTFFKLFGAFPFGQKTFDRLTFGRLITKIDFLSIDQMTALLCQNKNFIEEMYACQIYFSQNVCQPNVYQPKHMSAKCLSTKCLSAQISVN
jgi:hypothetical protein